MGTRIFMRAASAGGTESGLAQIDVPMNGNLLSVTWNCSAQLDTTGDRGYFQLSFGTAAVDVNDSRQIISQVSLGGLVFATAVGAVLAVANYHDSMEIPVGMGERIFLHGVNDAAVVAIARLILEFDFNLDKVAVRRR
jgi:hypothetical protein